MTHQDLSYYTITDGLGIAVVLAITFGILFIITLVLFMLNLFLGRNFLRKGKFCIVQKV